jgi:hypothetical protein
VEREWRVVLLLLVEDGRVPVKVVAVWMFGVEG